MVKLPFKAKFVAACKFLGLSSADVAVLDRVLLKAKEDSLWGLLIPQSANSTYELSKVVLESSGDALRLIPDEVKPLVVSMLSSPGGRTICANALCKVVHSLDDDTHAIVMKVADAVASSGCLGEQTEFDSLEQFVGDAVIPYVLPLIEESSSPHTEGINDSHADIVCKCPKCEYTFIPLK